MPGILTIAKKEFMDHVSDRTFLLCFVTLLIAMVGGAFYFVKYVQDWTISMVTQENQFVEGAGWKFNYIRFTELITSQLSSLGVLVAIALSFNSINKERTEGSLKVLLSYPIYKDKVILGKLIAGILVISIVAFTSMIISFSIVVFYLSIPLTADFLLRVVATTVVGIVLLAFFLCVGTVVSTVLRDTSAILLSLLLTTTILRYETYRVVLATVVNILSVLGADLKGPGPYSPTYYIPGIDPSYRIYSRLSPIEAYIKLSERLFNFGSVFEWTYWVPPGYPITPFLDQLCENLDLVAVPVLFAVAAFIACYIIFTRGEVA